jgi:hypothetical protein
MSEYKLYLPHPPRTTMAHNGTALLLLHSDQLEVALVLIIAFLLYANYLFLNPFVACDKLWSWFSACAGLHLLSLVYVLVVL